jgi:hypothetical protein
VKVPRSLVAALSVAVAVGGVAGIVTVLVGLDPGDTTATVLAGAVAVLVMWVFRQ